MLLESDFFTLLLSQELPDLLAVTHGSNTPEPKEVELIITGLNILITRG